MPANWQKLAAAAEAPQTLRTSALITEDSQTATTSRRTLPDSVFLRRAVYLIARRKFDKVSDTVRNPEAYFDRLQQAILEQVRPLAAGINEAEFSDAEAFAEFLSPPLPVPDVPEGHATASTGPCHVCDGNHWLYVNEEQNLVVRCNACGGRGEPMPQPGFNEVQRQRNREKLVAMMRTMR